jgi:HAD superfamily hydrolase (TIGR01458 family)
MAAPEAVLVDLDGTLTVAWHPIPGAAEALAWLRASGTPFLVATNATSRTREDLARILLEEGLDVSAEEILNATTVCGEYLRRNHPEARCFLLGVGQGVADLGDVALVDDDPDVVVVAGPDETFTWGALSRALRMLMRGAKLIAMHGNLSWMTEEGVQLDVGAYVLGLEAAAGVEAVVTGKPSPDFFDQCLRILGLEAADCVMVGDDLEADVLAAQRVGLRGILVRTGKFREETLAASDEKPWVVIDSIADLPSVLRRVGT